jgi:holo-[acyl-carrier protein] synthase
MIRGIGVDIVKLDRIKNNLSGIADKILSLEEKQIYESLDVDKRKIEFVGGRFAFKEALFKARKAAFAFNKVSLLNNEDGSPYVKDEPNIKVSISHEDDYVICFVVIETE